MIRQGVRWPTNRSEYCAALRLGFLGVACLGLIGQVLYDQHPVTALAVFPQWLLVGSLWCLWRQGSDARSIGVRGTLVFALLIPALSCLPLFIAWLGWKTNTLAICGAIPISDAASYYISAQTFLRDGFLDPSGQRRPLNIILTSLWLNLSADDFKLLLLIQALVFAAAAFLASSVVAAVHGFRAGLLLFAFVLVFAEPYLPSMLSETNGIICGLLALVGFLFAIYRRSLVSFFGGAFFLALGLAIRPSALLVLPCVVIAGAMMFGRSGGRRVTLAACLIVIVLLPSAISVALNRTMSRGEGVFNANVSYTVYGLVSGGKGWQQYQKDNPRMLDGLSEAERSHVILQASWQRFKARPVDLVRGLVVGQVLGPLQTFAQMARLAFLGAAGDPLKIIPAALILVISLGFAGVLLCQWLSRRHADAESSDFRLFFAWILIGYLISIPFFYKDGGLRLHAAILPAISYLLVWLLLPAGAARGNALVGMNADRLRTLTAAFGCVLLGSMGWTSWPHQRSAHFEGLSMVKSAEEDKIMFRFKPGWPECDLRPFEHGVGDKRPRWFSGAIPDDDYRSAGIRQISGEGSLYFGFDAGAGDWKIIHTDKPVGLLNEVTVESASHTDNRGGIYRDFYSAKTVQVIGAQ